MKTISNRWRCARFYVDKLVLNKVTVDPFLLVTDGDQEYYIAAWDEKGFVPELK